MYVDNSGQAVENPVILIPVPYFIGSWYSELDLLLLVTFGSFLILAWGEIERDIQRRKIRV